MIFVCECGKVFANKQNLQRHKQVCGNKTRLTSPFQILNGSFICTACNGNYSTKRALYAHVRLKRCRPAEKYNKNREENEEKEAKQKEEAETKNGPSITKDIQEEEKIFEQSQTANINPELQEKKVKDEKAAYITEAELDVDISDSVVSRLASIIAKSEEKIKLALKTVEEHLLKVKQLEQLPKELLPIKQKIYSALPDEINSDSKDKEADFLCRIDNEKTRCNYKAIISQFLKQIKHTPTLEDFKKFFAQPGEGKKVPSAATVSSKRAIILSFLKAEFNWTETGTAINLSVFSPPKPCYAPSRKLIGEAITYCRVKGFDKFAIFIWFAYSVGQRLSDLLLANANQVDKSGIISMIASKTQKFIQKKIPLALQKFLPLSGPFFSDLGGREKVQEMFRSISKEMSLEIPIKAKNLRAAHISSISTIVEAGRMAGSHAHSSTTQASYLDFGIFDVVFDMSEFFCAFSAINPKVNPFGIGLIHLASDSHIVM